MSTEGLRGLTARGVARRIGYTIGTIYNLFENLDDLIIHLNSTTLDSLYEAVSSESAGKEPEAALRAYARRYMEYTSKNPRLWRAVFEHQLPNGQEVPDWYEAHVLRLLGLAEEALKPFFRPGEEVERLHHARVLWGSLYGICSLAESRSLPSTESATGLVDTLIDNYVAALR
ncbi:MAG: TetR/AcrR family transcriptional regulator, partial [Alphaproteobacteria bacterium]